MNKKYATILLNAILFIVMLGSLLLVNWWAFDHFTEKARDRGYMEGRTMQRQIDSDNMRQLLDTMKEVDE